MSSQKLRLIFRPKSEIQTFFPPKIRWSPKKKKKVFTKIETDFSAEIVRFRLVGGMHPPIPPLNPPLSSTPNGASKIQTFLPLMLDTWNFQGRQIWKKVKTGQNLGVSKWGSPSNGPPKSSTFKSSKLDHRLFICRLETDRFVFFSSRFTDSIPLSNSQFLSVLVAPLTLHNQS